MTTFSKTMLPILLWAALVPLTAAAQSFEEVDRDRDGYASMIEITTANENATVAALMAFDTNFDQRLTQEQYEAFLKAAPLPRGTVDTQRAQNRQTERSAPSPQPRQRGYGS